MKTADLSVVKQKLESFLGSMLQSLEPDTIGTALGPIQWRSIPTDIEDDDTMAKLLELASLPPGSELVVITDASFGNGVGAFVLTAAEFDEFQRWHLDEFAERVFSGCDVIIWAPTDKRVWVVHHEGLYATVRLGA
jgi:hypothetical protein